MTQPTLVLASKSPRRRRMLGWLGLSFETTAARIDEAPLPGEAPVELAVRLAREKARAARSAGNPHEDGWFLAADTVVDVEGQSLGKPGTVEEARAMLRTLRDEPHAVHTCLALAPPDNAPVRTRRVTTEVSMRRYTDGEIAQYVATGDPMDKAGGYAIQHAGFDPVERVDICYANVVGLPFCALVKLLRPTWNLELSLMPALCLQELGYDCPGPDIGVAR